MALDVGVPGNQEAAERGDGLVLDVLLVQAPLGVGVVAAGQGHDQLGRPLPHDPRVVPPIDGDDDVRLDAPGLHQRRAARRLPSAMELYCLPIAIASAFSSPTYFTRPAATPSLEAPLPQQPLVVSEVRGQVREAKGDLPLLVEVPDPPAPRDQGLEDLSHGGRERPAATEINVLVEIHRGEERRLR